MALKPKLDGVREAFAQATDSATVEAMERATAILAGSGIVKRALKAGDRAPDFQVVDSQGREMVLSELLVKGPVVVSFNRGDWCPYCDAELAALEEARPAIQCLGAELVTLSPQLKGAATFSDPGSKIAQSFGVAFLVSAEMQGIYEGVGVCLPLHNGEGDWHLPLPATYVIGQDGRIALAFIDADYRNRLEPADVLAALTALRRRDKGIPS